MGTEIEVSKSNRQLVAALVENLALDELTAVQAWAVRLLDIRESRGSNLAKARAAIAATLACKVVWPAIKIAARRTKQVGWDNRGRTARLFLGASAVGVALFGSQKAGIAALGTAIGVPLWVVLGSGASFANLLIEEIRRRSARGDLNLKTTYTVIDAELIKPPL